MGNILFIDSSVRCESRTRALAQHLLQKLGGDVDTLSLDDRALPPLDRETLEMRSACCDAGDFRERYFDPAKQFARADTIVIAAPFWDGSFPAVLKKYIETVCVSGITFRYSPEGIPIGLCRAKRLYYVTTAGGQIFSDAYGYGYVSDLAKNMFGIGETYLIKAENLDIIGADIHSILACAKAEIDKLFQ